MAGTLPTYHAAFLDKARGILSTDPRIHTLLAGGSLIHGGVDEFSDLDLVVVVEEDSYTEVLASRMDIARGTVMSGWRPFGNVIIDDVWAWRGGCCWCGRPPYGIAVPE